MDGVLFNKKQTMLIQFPGGKAGSYTIPNSVTSIGYFAFQDCTNLTSVTIPNSVTSIENWAFSSCTGLTAITVDALNSVYSSVDGVLFNKSQTTLIRCPRGKAGSYTIPDSVTGIEWGAFSGCTSLTSITIPNSVTSIGDGAFSGCTSLTSVWIGNSVTSIGDNAFRFCTNLTNVTIPNSVTSIGNGAFVSCTRLSAITISDDFPRKVILPKGEIIGWKKLNNNVICKLRIPAEAKRVGGIVGKKCRAEFAVVLEGEGNSLTDQYTKVAYKIGEKVVPDKFDGNPLVECSTGIHFFLTKEEAEKFEM
jgi:hypothetical protein